MPNLYCHLLLAPRACVKSFYTLGVVIYSTPIAKMGRITEQIFSSSVIGELLLNIIFVIW